MSQHNITILAAHGALLAANKTGTAADLLAYDASREALLAECREVVVALLGAQGLPHAHQAVQDAAVAARAILTRLEAK